MNSTITLTEPPQPPTSMERSQGGESERERLLTTWRLYPAGLVDLISPEIEGGPDDGAGFVRMTEPNGDDIDEFHFSNAEEADDAVDYCLRRLNPGASP